MAVSPKSKPDSPRKSKKRNTPTVSPPGSLLDVGGVDNQPLPLSRSLNWLVELCGQIVQGGVYMVGGAPGASKSTLSRQIALDLAAQGHRCLFILSEEPATRLKAVLNRMTANWPNDMVRRAMSNLLVESNLKDLQLLPGFLARNVLTQNGQYRGTKLLILDSIQGNGISHTATEKWAALHEFGDLTRNAGITSFWISHLNKRNEFSGLRDTEHAVDAAIMLRKAGLNQLKESQNYFMYTLVAVYELTRSAYRRLLDPFLPIDASSSGDIEPKTNSARAPLTPIDAAVSIADSLRWMGEIVDDDPIALAGTLADIEPGIVGVAINISNKTRDRLIAMGASVEIAEAAAGKTLLAGVVTAELLRRGHAKLWNDFGEDKPTGGPHGK